MEKENLIFALAVKCKEERLNCPDDDYCLDYLASKIYFSQLRRYREPI